MSLHTKIQTLRSKPRHVRERFLFTALIACAVILIALWSVLTFFIHQEKRSAGINAFQVIKKSVTTSFSDIPGIMPASSEAAPASTTQEKATQQENLQ